jgi:selenocysteine lyase/cysteine desulfurase
MAPLCTPAREALEAWDDLCSSDPVVAYSEYPRREATRLRERVAGLIGAQAEEIALLDSTSRGNNLAVAMIDAPEGANVVVDVTTYPSALYPWLLPTRSHVQLRRASSKNGLPVIEDFKRLVDDRTVAISVSHVCRMTGFRHELDSLAALAHAHGAYLLVDGAQSVGATQIDVQANSVDFLSFGAMKWLLGTPGIGFLFVRSELQAELAPPHVGPQGTRLLQRGDEERLDFFGGATRHALSSMHWGGLCASRRGADLLATVPLAALERRILDLSGYLIDGLRSRGIAVHTPVDAARRAGVVSFTFEQPDSLRLHLRARGVDVWGYEEQRIVRADPHVYNTFEDVDRLLAGIDEWRPHSHAVGRC